MGAFRLKRDKKTANVPVLKVFDREAVRVARPKTTLHKTIDGVPCVVREWTDDSYQHCGLCKACDLAHGTDGRAWCVTREAT
jgi:hypothetical protein